MVSNNGQLVYCSNQILMQKLQIVPNDKITLIINCDENKGKYLLERLVRFFEREFK